jgi:hypothetical protein
MGEIEKLRWELAGYRGLTTEQMRDKLAELGKADPEVGHGLADELLVAALTAIRDGHPNPATLARDVLVVHDADFARWYA